MATLCRFKLFGQYLGKHKKAFTLSPRLAAGNFFHDSVNEKHGESTVSKTDDKLMSSKTDEELMSLFESWIVSRKKVYKTVAEKDKRFQIFKDNRRKTTSMGPFLDLTNEEFQRDPWVNGCRIHCPRAAAPFSNKLSKKWFKNLFK